MNRSGMDFAAWPFATATEIELQSKAGKPLTRYFPELVAALQDLKAEQFVLDGEIIIPVDGEPSFDELLHAYPSSGQPCEACSPEQHPCLFIVFDLLVNDRRARRWWIKPLEQRRPEVGAAGRRQFFGTARSRAVARDSEVSKKLWAGSNRCVDRWMG